MIRNLDDDFEMYDISVNKMVSFDSNFKIGNFVAFISEFGNLDGSGDIWATSRAIILQNGNKKQIFQMVDGKFILEIETGDYCEYYYSEDLQELVDFSENFN